MMKRSYLSGLLIAALMMVCSVSLASEAPSSGFVPAYTMVMDVSQPVMSAVADVEGLTSTDPVSTVGTEPCKLNPDNIVLLVACNTGESTKPIDYRYAVMSQSMPTSTKVPI